MNTIIEIRNLPTVEVPAPNTMRIFLTGGLTLFYSYSACVGYAYKGERVFCNRFYSNTTSKHMTATFNSDKKERIDEQLFNSQLNEALKAIFTQAD